MGPPLASLPAPSVLGPPPATSTAGQSPSALTRSLENQLAHQLLAEDLANLEPLHHRLTDLVLTAERLVGDRLHLLLEPVERGHVLVLDHEEQIEVLRVAGAARQHLVG